MDTRPSEGSNRCSEESDGTKSQLTDWPQGQVVCGRSSIHVDECLHIENIPCTLRCGTKVPGIILWVTRVSLGLAQTCAEEPRIMCRQGCRAGWLRLKPSERKSRISAGTRLPQVLRQHRKQDGRDKLHLSVCNKKKKPLRTGKMVQRHHICCSGTSGRQQFLFGFVCAAERRAWWEVTALASWVPAVGDD